MLTFPLMLCIHPDATVMPPLYVCLTYTWENIWQREKINQYAPINAVKGDRNPPNNNNT